VASLLGLHLVLALWGALRNSVTFDENFHLPSGVLIAARGDFRISPFNPPLVKTLFALPALAAGARLPDPAAVDTQDQWVAGESFMRRNADRYHRVFFAARCVVALISLATGFLVWKYARRLQGRAAGLLALAFYVTAAESLAHAGVATMDVATGFGMLAAVYAFWGFCRSGRWTWWLKTVFALGFCALTRFNTAILGPILLLLAVLGTALTRIRRPARVWLGLLLAVPATLVILDLGYLAHVSFRPLSAWQFASPSFQHLQQRVPWLRLPLPDAYLFGLDIQAREGAGGTPTYLLHQVRSGRVWYYLPLAFLFKWPLGFLGALAARFGRDLFPGPRPRRWHEAFLLVPIAMILGSAMFLFTLNIGIRYMFPLVPLLCVWLGGLAPPPSRVPAALRRRVRRWVVAGTLLATLQAIEVGAHAPWYLSFFNWPSGGSSGGQWLVNDSNVDWGQGLIALKDELARRGIQRVHLAYHGTTDPAIYGIDYLPYRGGTPSRDSDWLAISSYYYVGLWQRMTTTSGRTAGPIRFDFQRLWGARPVAMPAGCILLFSIDRSGVTGPPS